MNIDMFVQLAFYMEYVAYKDQGPAKIIVLKTESK